MKQTYYLIEVYEYSEISRDYKFVGYYTGIYTVRGGQYCGYDSKPDYDRVKRFNSEQLAQNFIYNKLDNVHFGGEANTVRYQFKVVSMELEPLNNKSNITMSRQARHQAVDIIKSCIPKDRVYQAYTDYCLDNNLDDNEAQDVLNALNHIYNQILKIL